MNPDIVKVLLLGRLVSFMLVVYVGFGLVVEWKSRREGSKLKAFGRLLCRPLVYPVARFSPEGTPYVTILRRTAIAVLAVWIAFIVASEVLISRG
ncbi:MAG: hypothetical protein KBF21_13600 [Thermoanaerobaculia bacterium]|jgi:uncharacterized protein YggT (Ycf19 family)|nr:hypothetical protein [Thermoanaerobaculia bacterium]MBP9825253.1 hypothetical protein [Thermoanaerobaculia bacterium]